MGRRWLVRRFICCVEMETPVSISRRPKGRRSTLVVTSEPSHAPRLVRTLASARDFTSIEIEQTMRELRQQVPRTVVRHRPPTRLLAAFAAGALLCGCGSSQVAAKSGDGSSTKTSTTKTSTSPAARPAAKIALESVPVAVAACERAIETAPKFPASAKAELRFVCHHNVNGVVYEDHRNARVICNEVVNASRLGGARAKRRSFSACYATATRHRSH
jgi:hypothetical protein